MLKNKLINLILNKYPDLSLRDLLYYTQCEKLNYFTVKQYYYNFRKYRVIPDNTT